MRFFFLSLLLSFAAASLVVHLLTAFHVFALYRFALHRLQSAVMWLDRHMLLNRLVREPFPLLLRLLLLFSSSFNLLLFLLSLFASLPNLSGTHHGAASVFSFMAFSLSCLACATCLVDVQWGLQHVLVAFDTRLTSISSS